jgi:hypothetical protein
MVSTSSFSKNWQRLAGGYISPGTENIVAKIIYQGSRCGALLSPDDEKVKFHDKPNR